MNFVTIGAIESGAYVLRAPQHGIKISVPLRRVARRLQVQGIEIGADAMRALPRLGDPQVSGAIWNKLKKKAKSAVKTVVNTAKKVANNKLVKTLYKVAKAAVPPPYNVALQAVETGVKFGKAIAKGSKKAKAALPIVKKLAKGQVSLAAAKAAGKKLGLKPNTIRDAAATLKIKAAAPKSPKARQLLDTAAKIEATTDPANKRIVTAQSGRRYEVSVSPA